MTTIATTPIQTGPRGRPPASGPKGTATTGRSAPPRMWHCIVIAVPTAATSHHRRSAPDHAFHAPARAIALDNAMRLGFQMNVDSSTAAADVAMASAATTPAIGPPTDRPSHHTTPTAAIPASAITATPAGGEAAPGRAAPGGHRA